ncbi:MAG TPA: DNA polymerase III subunit delta [Candidatus Eremiobacteraeota bacterium]|nr:MAG: DNA polymerase III subunit delta [bacterium ADurb.Bin363]HPZ10367.1 DNA polymerase III subunit delta [Candidatus Eremiobacteraeota bacterium]
MLDYFKALSEKEIKTIARSNIVLLHGDQEILMEEVLEKIINETVDKNFKDFDYVMLNINFLKGEKEDQEKPAGLKDIIEHLEAFPFGSKRKVVIVKRIDKLEIEEKNRLATYLKSISLRAFLVLMTSGKAKTTLLSLLGSKLEKDIKARGTIINCTLKPNEMIKWVIQKTAMVTGKTIGQEESKHLLKRSGTELRHIINEIQKISSFVEPNFRITKEAIDICCHQETQSGVFELTDAVSMGQTFKGLSIFSDLIKQQEEPLRLLGLLSNHFNLIRQARELKDKKIPPREIIAILQKIGEHPFRIQKALDIKYFSLEGLKKAHRWLLDADLSIKTGRHEPVIALELLIILLCQEATRMKH